MASPQIEDGRTEIANELVEALAKINLNCYESRILWAIIRKTYGWHKRTDRISLSQLAELTGLASCRCANILRQLEHRNIIVRYRDSYVTEIGIQKDYEAWENHNKPVLNQVLSDSKPVLNEAVPNEVVLESVLGSTQIGTETSTQIGTNKSNKSTNTKAKYIYGEFQNILLTDEEHEKLLDRFGKDGAAQRIEKLSSYVASKGKKYKSHYATILTWENHNSNGHNKMITKKDLSGHACSTKEDYERIKALRQERNHESGP